MSRPVHLKDGLNYSGSGGGSNNHLTDKMVANYENSSIAVHSYDIGEQFIYTNKLYEVTSAISIGDTIVTEGSNANCIESDSLTEQIAKKGSADNFIGTKEQWEALTPEQQAQYKTMDLLGEGGGGTSGGHTIVNEAGTTYPARAKLKFDGAIVSDDETNDATVVETVNPVEYEEDRETIQNQLTDQTNVLGAKNLIPYPYVMTTKTQAGITFTDNGNGLITANAASATTGAVSFMLWRGGEDTLPKGEYILSDSGESSDNVYIAINKEDSTGTYIADLTRLRANTHEVKFNIDYNGYSQVGIQIYARAGATASNLVFHPMLRLASDPDNTYVPYAMTNRELTEDVGTLKTNLKATYNSAEIPFKFGIDANGNYGYIKAGADSVTPFKTGAYHRYCINAYSENTVSTFTVPKANEYGYLFLGRVSGGTDSNLYKTTMIASTSGITNLVELNFASASHGNIRTYRCKFTSTNVTVTTELGDRWCVVVEYY